jgi:hypothetical protein
VKVIVGFEDVLEQMRYDLYTNRISNRQLAVMLRTTHTKINDALAGKREFEFSHLVQVLRLLYLHNVEYRRECLRHYFVTMSPRNERLGLEVTNLFGESDLQQEIKEKVLAGTNRVNHQLVKFYELLELRIARKLSPSDFFRKVKHIRSNRKTTATEVQIVSEFAYIYSLLDYADYRMVSEHTNHILPMIASQKHETLQHAFSLRAKEMLTITSLRSNEVEAARKVSWDILNDPCNFYLNLKAHAYLSLGESYIFTDYDKAKRYMEEGIALIGTPTNMKLKTWKQVIINTLTFLKMYWEKELDTVEPHHPAELAFLYCKQGRKHDAIAILAELQRRNGDLSAFQLCYLGLATGNKLYFEKSIEKFQKSGDFFYMQLPKQFI